MKKLHNRHCERQRSNPWIAASLTLLAMTALIDVTVHAATITCPISGNCDTAGYKTVPGSASCGVGFMETTSETLVIYTTGSDDKGDFRYPSCTR